MCAQFNPLIIVFTLIDIKCTYKMQATFFIAGLTDCVVNFLALLRFHTEIQRVYLGYFQVSEKQCADCYFHHSLVGY